MKAYDKYEVDETFKCWSSDLAELNVIEVIPLKMLDEMRAEIEHLHEWAFSREDVLQIIDRYRGKRE